MRSRFLDGPAGKLDSRWHGDPSAPPVVLLHPHPRFGGTMGSRLVYDLAAALADAGWQSIRFDFRGVGRSEGAYAEGLGESDDAAAVLAHVENETGQEPAVVGYSFGAACALRVATRRRLPKAILVGVPLDLPECALRPMEDARDAQFDEVTLVAGDQDEFVSPAQLRDLEVQLRPVGRLVLIPGAHHFLEPSHNAKAVAAVLAALGPVPHT